MKAKIELKTTMCSASYCKALKATLVKNEGLCHICSYHRGCNSRNRYHPERNWKEYRKHQWK